MKKPTDRILRRALNAANAADTRRQAEKKEAARRFDAAILHLDELLSALLTVAPDGDGQCYFADAFRKAIAKAESLNSSRRFKDAWTAVKELRAELTECLAEAPNMVEPEVEEAPVVEEPKAPTLTNRQRKQAKKAVRCVARNERTVAGDGDIIVTREGGRTVSKVESPLRAALRAALAA